MKHYKNLFLVVMIILFLVLMIQIIEPTIGTTLSSVLTTCTTIIGFISVFYEMKRSADIDECNFILETFKHFTSDSTTGVSIIYEKLDLLFSEGKNTLSKEDRKYVVQYLQFFEMLAGLIEKDSISIADIDKLYGYSFFIAANCKTIQDMELVVAKDYYEGIFKIYPIWLNYRISNNKPVPFSDTPLVDKSNNNFINE